MAESPLVKKLGVKPGNRVLIANAPENVWEQLSALPDGTELKTSADGQFDVILYFAREKHEVDQQAEALLRAARPEGYLWMAYPKKSAKTGSNLTRDVGWDSLAAAGWVGVAIIAIDETWSAVRFRPTDRVKRR